MKTLLILPNQLFDKKYLKENKITDKTHKVVIYEHPHYFKSYKYNKKKLLLHFSSMRYYRDYLEKNGFEVSYIKYENKFGEKTYEMFESADELDLKPTVTYDNPNYLLNDEMHEAYQKKTDKYIFNNFYMWAKEQLNILPGVKSTDKENREKMPKDVKIPKVKSLPKSDMEYIENEIKRVNNKFSGNYGHTDQFIYPVTHRTAKAFLTDFIENKFKTFGSYQDYIREGESYMYHSVLSSSINIGLIHPKEIMEEMEKHKKKIPMNSYEGFIRQLFWREYQFYCYRTIEYKKALKKSFFGNKKKLTKAWYEGKTGNEVIDKTIVKAFDTAYLHHIERLMIMGNYMNLSEIKPEEGKRWFIEFSIDSYEWVMHQNVYDMVFFTTKTMRKPYISGPNYVLNMSNYKKGDWVEDWRDKYDKFVKKHKDILWKYRYHFPTLNK